MRHTHRERQRELFSDDAEPCEPAETVEVSRDTAETAYGLLRALQDGVEVQEYGSDVRARQELADVLDVGRSA